MSRMQDRDAQNVYKIAANAAIRTRLTTFGPGSVRRNVGPSDAGVRLGGTHV